MKFKTLLVSSLLLSATSASATLVGPFTSGWEVLQNDDAGLSGLNGTYDKNGNLGHVNSDGEGTAAHGGQHYDAEYLLYKYDAQTNILSLGLQTGFNLETNYNGGFRSGDLALSFDGGPKYDYEYAIDFGSKVNYKDTNGDWQMKAADNAGLYSVNQWTDGTIQYNINGELAMLSGTEIAGATVNAATHTNYSGVTSYTKTMSFDLSLVGLTSFDVDDFDAYWTMSCGNDVITTKVPEPSILLLLSSGILSLLGGAAIRRRKLIA